MSASKLAYGTAPFLICLSRRYGNLTLSVPSKLCLPLVKTHDFPVTKMFCTRSIKCCISLFMCWVLNLEEK